MILCGGSRMISLFGNKLRDEIEIYWSHGGTTRVRTPDLLEKPAIKSLQDVKPFCEEINKTDSLITKPIKKPPPDFSIASMLKDLRNEQSSLQEDNVQPEKEEKKTVSEESADKEENLQRAKVINQVVIKTNPK